MRPLYLLTALPVARAVERSPLDWPNVLQQPWLFDQGSTYGFRLEAGGVRGPAPDWALASSIPLVDYGVLSEDAAGVAASFSYPGSLRFENNFTVGGSPLQVIAHLVFKSANMSVIRVMVKNHGPQPVVTRFRAALSNINVTQSPENAVVFSLPAPQVPCFSGQDFSRGSLFFSSTFLSSGSQQNLTWRHANQSADSLVVLSSNVSIETLGVASAFISIAFAGNAASPGASASELQEVFDNSIKRWKSYLGLLMAPEVLDRNMQWVAVKALMTLMNNWRSVPGLPDGVLPSYRGYESGFWSWDSYKQAVGMVHFAPQLAKDQLRLIVSARNTETGHIPDKVDRCGAAGGCNGKPPLLAWAAWQVFQATHDFSFLQEMYNISKQFHDYWYLARDVKGAGLCSWTQGMESGMDNGVRFLPEYAQMVTNVSSHVTTFNFWSIDLNAYLYKDKLTFANMANALGMDKEAKEWTAAAGRLLPKLRQTFFVPDERAGFFSDVYFNGTALPVQGCEGYAALFAEVASLPQARQVADNLRDPGKFLLNFSLPSVSRQNPFYDPNGYWRGPTWVDQTWFAYTGLRRYASAARSQGDRESEAVFSQLASELKGRLFSGRGFSDKDQTPFNEHYHPETGNPEGAEHFSWTAAHALMWALEDEVSVEAGVEMWT